MLNHVLLSFPTKCVGSASLLYILILNLCKYTKIRNSNYTIVIKSNISRYNIAISRYVAYELFELTIFLIYIYDFINKFTRILDYPFTESFLHFYINYE